ncbi:MAG: lipase/acyltransferase domain-containing protein [Oscillochloridaceae bacterium umkhey_bin13]
MTRPPVILVPGICGSFNLGVLLDWRGPTLNGWSFPPFIDYGKGFLEAFTKAGYTRDRDLFVAFYDWRKSVRDSANLYLRPWIERAKQRSGASKVILIGHSMGGLVSRSYIQGSHYAGDVAQLITLGTPHRGAAAIYRAWGGGEPIADPTTKVVFDVYLWYLRHTNPFATGLDPLRTMRTQVPSIRDLLALDNFLLNEGGPPVPKQQRTMVERNLVGEMLNQPVALDTLAGRVPVTTVSGIGFETISQIVVAGPPLPPGNPPRFPDGLPVRDLVDHDGDGSVLRTSARLEHPKITNRPPLNGAQHGALPDLPDVLHEVFATLGLGTPVLGEAPVTEPRLVIMTASPVTMTVEAPGGAPMQPSGILGAAPEGKRATRRKRRMQAKDHGHEGKHLNIVVIPQPTEGSYQVELEGTASGDFALGAMLISPEGTGTLLGGSDEATEVNEATQPRDTPITTRYGRVAAGTRLFFEVRCSSLEAAPTVELDAQRTTESAVERMQAAMGSDAPSGVILGGGDSADQLDAMRQLAVERLALSDPELAEALVAQLQATRD